MPPFGNPYGTLGPSPGRVSAINATRRKKVTPRPAPAAPVDPYAGAKATLDELIKAMLGDVSRQRDEARRIAEQEAAQKLAQAQALAQGLQQLGIAPAIQAAFQNAGQAQAGLAQGFSGATRAAADAAAAEQIRQLSGTGQEGAVRNQGEAMGNVQYGQHGYIPATALNTTGAAFGAQAALQPGFALQFGQIEKAAREQEWADELSKFADMEADVYAKKPELFLDIVDKMYDSPSSTRLQKSTLANGQIQWWNPQTGKPVGKPQGPVRPTKAPSGGKVTYRNLSNGQIQRFDEAGNPIGAPFGPPRAAAKSAKSKGYNLQFKDYGDYHQWTDPRTLKRHGARYTDPKTGSTTKPGRPDGMTPTQVRTARTDAYNATKGWWANGMKNDDGVEIKPQDFLKAMINEGGIPFDIAVRQLAKFYKPASKWFKNKPPQEGVAIPTSFTSTHPTDNLGWPAVDIMGKPGTPVKAPEDGVIVRHGSAQGGEAMYFRSNSGKMYWLGHIDKMLPVGRRVRRGQRIASISADHANPHVHVAIQGASV